MATIAMPIAEDFEDSEFTIPHDRLRDAGHEVVTLGAERGRTVVGKRGKAKVAIDATAEDYDAAAFDAVVIPGGYSPDHLRTNGELVSFLKKFVATGRPVAAVCHGPQLLIEADAVRGRTVTSWPSIRKDLINAGAGWVDRELVEDANLITSRKPEDLEAFSAAILRRLPPADGVDPGVD
jgi:protease I